MPFIGQREKYIDWHHGQWRVRIPRNGKIIYLGCFRDCDDAKRARDKFLKELPRKKRHEQMRYIFKHPQGWQIMVRENGQQIYIGVHKSLEKAMIARDEYLRRRFFEKMSINGSPTSVP